MKIFFSIVLFLLSYCPILLSQNWQQVEDFNWPITIFFNDKINNILYIGGYFRWSGIDTFNSVCNYDGVKLSSMGDGLKGNCVNYNCTAPLMISRYKDDILVGVPNNEFAGIDGIVKWDGTAWSSLGANSPAPWVASGLDKDDRFYAVGTFQTAGKDTCNSFAYWDGHQWTGMGFPKDYLFEEAPSLTALEYYKGEWYAGGNCINYIDGKQNHDIARYDGIQWRQLGEGLKGGWSNVTDMVVYKGDLYVSGYFQKIAGNIGNKIMRWDGEQWHEVGGGMCSPSAIIEQMIIYQDKLIVVGVFDCVGEGLTARNLAAWDGERWCSFGDSYFDNRILCAEVFRNDLYIGGGFTQIDGQPVKYFAKWIGDHATDTCSAAISPVIEPSASDAILRISPNPASGQVTLTLSNTSPTGLLRFTNALGAVVREVSVSGSRVSISVADLPAGVYVVQHIEDGAVRSVERVVVQR